VTPQHRVAESGRKEKTAAGVNRNGLCLNGDIFTFKL